MLEKAQRMVFNDRMMMPVFTLYRKYQRNEIISRTFSGSKKGWDIKKKSMLIEVDRFSELFDVWVKKLLGSDYRIRSTMSESKHRKYRVTIEEIKRGLELNLNQVGIGISQLLPIIVLILTSKAHDLLLIENPEVHLHPRLQALFVDLCLFAVENRRKLVVETHSEHVVNRLRFRVKESPHYLDKISVLFLDKCDGDIQYTEVHIDKDGKIDYWPENFFDQSYKDLLGIRKWHL